MVTATKFNATAILRRIYVPWRGCSIEHIEAYLRDPYRKSRKNPRRERRMARRLRRASDGR